MSTPSFPGSAPATLRFRPDRTFTILQINDTQVSHCIDQRTLALMTISIASARPCLVVVNGDIIGDRLENRTQALQAMNNIAATLAESGVPWCITFGNHDADSEAATGTGELDQLAYYRRYPGNLNIPPDPAAPGAGTMYLPILSSNGSRPVFGLWLINSGRYAPAHIAGQDLKGYPTWDGIRPAQVSWYRESSRMLESQVGAKIPSLMFTHIPLWEHRFMWFGGLEGRDRSDEVRGSVRHGIVGERNESECFGPFNAGMFATILERGETKGVFCGHDHTNTYHGNYFGVLLGYAPGAGFESYGLAGDQKNRLRGVRTFTLREDTADAIPETEVLLASALGIDTSPLDQYIDPLPLPAGHMN